MSLFTVPDILCSALSGPVLFLREALDTALQTKELARSTLGHNGVDEAPAPEIEVATEAENLPRSFVCRA